MDDETPPDDPFAPLPEGSGEGHEGVEPDIWAVQMPAPEEPPKPSRVSLPIWGAAVAHWIYRDADGSPLFATYRFQKPELPNGKVPKDVRPYSYGDRDWIAQSGKSKGKRIKRTGWHMKRPCLPVPLYGLDRLAARPDAPVLVLEGEKSADAAAEMFPDHVAVSHQGGSNNGHNADWAALTARTVVIWPDNDKPGLKHAGVVVAALKARGVDARVVKVPAEWDDGWDVADTLPPGVTAETLQAMLADPEPVEDRPDHAEEIARLADLPGFDYQVQRKSAAEMLGVGVTALDKLVKAERSRRFQEAAAEHRSKPPPAPGEVRWPFGFSMRSDGLYVDVGEDDLLHISAPFQVLGETRNGGSEEWGLWLKWFDRDYKPHTWQVPSHLLTTQPGELEALLISRGLGVSVDPAHRAQLRLALGGVRSGDRVLIVQQTGWLPQGEERGHAYVLPDGTVIGRSEERLVLHGADTAPEPGTAGGLVDWQREIASRSIGNTLMTFSLCAAFAPPLLDVLGEPSCGYHLSGKSKSGKTLAGVCGISVWAKPKKGHGLRDWRSTANAMESVAEQANDNLLVLDEMHQADPKEVVGAIYMLANSSGKERLHRDTTLRKKKVWRIVVASTGELDIASFIARVPGQTVPAGADVRMPSIPITPGKMWTNLHGAENEAVLMRILYQMTGRFYGTAGRAFLEHLIEARADGEGDIVAGFEAMREKIAEALPPDADLQVQDVARRFALFALAGEMAAAWKIVPWQSGAAARACIFMLRAWLARRGSTAASEEIQHVRAIRLFLIADGASRFVAYKRESLSSSKWIEVFPDRPIINRAGWRFQERDGRYRFVVPSDVWREICTKATLDPAETAKTLLAQKFLIPGEGRNVTKKVTVPGIGKDRFYVLHPDILGQFEEERGEQAAAE